ncbi:dephospho-CoA kinase [Domibacillus epiphyticus]|uniref:Dephospho-CoA kinase n=1 Tax=Domibacillus epiphyticus TaxID=1714355 RepID=A0A1V2A8Z0_9BACI|nr:dephospho-CoA kinase [Domibacillus epiphyticus]OMP67475.1 dephospho-CoA kinase [Domibacillus epiphyticus]
MAIIIGLTGGIASGKSTVSSIMAEKGFTVIDADKAARIVVEPGQPALQKIINVFGSAILTSEGTLDRVKMGGIVFHDEEKRKQLNEIVHPSVRKWMLDEKEKAVEAGKRTIIFDLPLLFESKLTWMVDKSLLIYVDPETQLKRLMKRNSYTEQEAHARIRSQMPINEKKELADYIIDNSGSLDETVKQVNKWIARLRLET